MESPLAGKHILVPPSRPELNSLLKALEAKGAQVTQWPRIRVAEPQAWGPMEAAIRQAASFDWLLFAGSRCVTNFFARLQLLGAEPGAVFGRRVAAIGHGALAALKDHGVAADVYPARHVASDVVAAIEAQGPLRGKRFLLVRVAGAPRGLPELLKAKRAVINEVVGYRLVVEAGAPPPRPDALALANPTAVRILARGLRSAALKPGEFFSGTVVASVGPATTEAARAAGLAVNISSAGSQKGLVEDLLRHFGKGGE